MPRHDDDWSRRYLAPLGQLSHGNLAVTRKQQSNHFSHYRWHMLKISSDDISSAAASNSALRFSKHRKPELVIP
jgi:hypothetical protein